MAEEKRKSTELFIDRVAVRLPPFWPEDPELWFAQADAQFDLSGITEDTTKFKHILTQLDHKYMKEVKDLIRSPPKEHRYDTLKIELTKRISISRSHQISQLLSHEELGDRRPSQFLRHLKSLAADSVTEEFLRSLWSSRLPQHVQAIILTQASAKLDEVAELADKICEVTPTLQQVASTSAVTPDKFEMLLSKLDELLITQKEQQISQLSSTYHSRDRNQSRYRSRSHNRTPGVCWYHNTFGDKAIKCTPPCNYTTGNRNGSL